MWVLCHFSHVSLWCYGLYPARLLCTWVSPGKNTGMGCHAFLQGIFPTQRSNPCLLHLLNCRQVPYCLSHQGSPKIALLLLLLLLLSPFSCVRLCATPLTAAHEAPPSLGFSKQEHWSGLPFPPAMHEREKWKWSRSVVSDSSRPHGLQPTRLFCPWDFPGKSTGVGCHCLLQEIYLIIN